MRVQHTGEHAHDLFLFFSSLTCFFRSFFPKKAKKGFPFVTEAGSGVVI